MSAIRKLSLTVAGLFLGLGALFLVTGTANAATTTIQCDNDWQSPCP